MILMMMMMMMMIMIMMIMMTVSCPPPVPIHRGDLIEFLVGERTWFLVEVTGRGKLGGKNQNYLNVRYRCGQITRFATTFKGC